MNGKVEISKLKDHPKNNYYFTDLDNSKYEEVKRSIMINGIRDPIKCTTSFTVISGHQRLNIAKELGMKTVPVQIIDVDEWKAEYLLIAENVERRGQAETDPIKKSRIANFLKEYWGVLEGRGGDRRSKDKMPLKSIKDISTTLGESERNTKRILKLNELIPELQTLVSEGKLGTTAGEQLAHLTKENQYALFRVLGEEIKRITVAKAKEYRSVEQEDKTARKYEQKLKELQEAKEQAEREAELARQSERIALNQLQEEQNKEPKVIEKEVIKTVDNTDYEQLERLNRQIEEMSGLLETTKVEKRELEIRLKNERNKTKEFNKVKRKLEEKEEEIASLSREQTRLKNRRMLLDEASFMARDVGAWVRKIRHYIYERDGGLHGDKEAYRAIESMIKTLEDILAEVKSWKEIEHASPLNNQNVIIDADYIDV